MLYTSVRHLEIDDASFPCQCRDDNRTKDQEEVVLVGTIEYGTTLNLFIFQKTRPKLRVLDAVVSVSVYD